MLQTIRCTQKDGRQAARCSAGEAAGRTADLAFEALSEGEHYLFPEAI
jgi:hypothetical protein